LGQSASVSKIGQPRVAMLRDEPSHAIPPSVPHTTSHAIPPSVPHATVSVGERRS